MTKHEGSLGERSIEEKIRKWLWHSFVIRHSSFVIPFMPPSSVDDWRALRAFLSISFSLLQIARDSSAKPKPDRCPWSVWVPSSVFPRSLFRRLPPFLRLLPSALRDNHRGIFPDSIWCSCYRREPWPCPALAYLAPVFSGYGAFQGRRVLQRNALVPGSGPHFRVSPRRDIAV